MHKIPQARYVFGVAIGHALGMVVEFKSLGTFDLVTGCRSGELHGLSPAQGTDDTSMAIS
jgi:ADP-ribosylglycohydrolase